MRDLIKNKIQSLKENNIVDAKTFQKGQKLYMSDACMLLSLSGSKFDFLVEDGKKTHEVQLQKEDDNFFPWKKKKPVDWDEYSVAALLQLLEKLNAFGDTSEYPGKRYTREGMIYRVMDERRQRAEGAEYRIEFANNIYGEHQLTNERGVQYRITLRDFETETGYVNSLDLKTNKLGTTKHIMYAFDQLKLDKKLFKKLKKEFPFVEIFLDPLNDYKITWFYPHDLDVDTADLIKNYFGKSKTLKEDKVMDFLEFINEAEFNDKIKIRPEVYEKVERAWNQKMLNDIRRKHEPDFSLINATLFDYQKKGVEFALFKEGAIIADEMGLGKTIQAISIAVMKKKVFGFERTLVICPASLKAQWKEEIEKFSNEKAIVVEGIPAQRAELYATTEAFFLILNYETILRDHRILNKYPADFIILDEAQRIKNYDTKTAQSIKKLQRKHALVITGTPIENRLIDLYSIVQFVDPYFLAPLWEFSYQHCYFDEKMRNKNHRLFQSAAPEKTVGTYLAAKRKTQRN